MCSAINKRFSEKSFTIELRPQASGNRAVLAPVGTLLFNVPPLFQLHSGVFSTLSNQSNKSQKSKKSFQTEKNDGFSRV